jgi:phosphoribosylamine--glycine ligase
VCAKGADIREAQRKAYEAVATISWANELHRNDIGWRAVAREQG